MADVITIKALQDASLDAKSLSEFVFKPASFMVQRRLAPSINTLQYYLDLFENISIGGEFNSAKIESLTVNTGEAGTQASVATGGTPSNRTFALTIPRGDKGVDGKSAYQSALDNGFVGTEAEWKLYLKSDGSIQALQQFMTNPASTEVSVPDYGNIPSLQGYISTMFENGGLPATPFATKVLMEASALVDGDYAVVTDDTINNGLYLKTAEVWVKSAYDAVSQKRLADELDTRAELSGSSNILELEDVVGKLILFMQSNGELHIPNLDKSVQKSLRDILLDVADIDTRIVYDDASSLFKIYDSNNKLIVSITNRGSLIINDVVTSGGSVDKRLSDLESNAVSDINTEILKATDRAIATRDKEPMLLTSNLFTQAELETRFAFAPSLCRISENEYITFCEARMGGDFGVSWLVQRKLTINDDYTTTLGDVSIFADKGTEDGQPFSCINTCVIKVETGLHTGRIYVYYLKVFYQAQRDVTFYKYSDDNGETWSDEIDMTSFFPDIATWKLVVPGAGGKAIQLKEGEHRGRIIIPCWHGDTNYPTSQAGLLAFILYSDDGGETYQIGAESSFAGSNECQVAELDGGGFMLLVRDGSTTKRTEVSFDGGLTLEQPSSLGNIDSNKVESGFCQFKNIYDLSVPKLMITSPTEVNRYNLGLYISYDNGKNFELVKVLSQDRASYSDIVPIDESHILVAYSSGVTDPDRNVLTVIVNLKQLMLGE